MYAGSDVGRIRKKNQDYFFSREDLGIAICADGIGGRPGGEVASRVACERISKELMRHAAEQAKDVPRLLTSAIDKANREVLKVGSQSEGLKGMGTTVNALYFCRGSVFIGHVGDSRTYLFFEDHFWQLTVDHNIEVYVEKGWFPQEVLDQASKPDALVRALGLSGRCEADVYERKVRVGEVFLTCSDGLSGMVSDHKIREILCQNRHRLEAVPKLLIAEANRSGGKDNITVILSEVASLS